MNFSTIAIIAASAAIAAPVAQRGGGRGDREATDRVGMNNVRNSAFQCYMFAYTTQESCEAAMRRCRPVISMCGTTSEIVYIPFGIN